MGAPSAQSLTLLDTENQLQWCDRKFDQRIFIRFTNHDLCLEHVRHHVIRRSDEDMHFYFSDLQSELIENPQEEFNDIYKYIICRDEGSKASLWSNYGRDIARELVLLEDLEFHMGHLEISLLFALMKRQHYDSLQYQDVASIIQTKLDQLNHIMRQHAPIQSSEQPIEIR